jgi:cell division control protein 6
MAPNLKLDKTSNIFIYGKPGSGKTLTTKYVIKELQKMAILKNIPLVPFYMNCKLRRIADTEYRIIAEVARELGKSVPVTGLPTEEVYNLFIEATDSKKQILVLILDEIDQLVKKTGDGILYNLTRLNEELKKAQITLIGISNDIFFLENLDSRVRSSLSEEEVTFPPYNAIQLQEILKQRADIAFRPGVIEDGVIEKCAAYAAQSHGDARRALELLRVAGEIAERNGFNTMAVAHIDDAEERIEHDQIIELVKNQPKHFQLVFYTILIMPKQSKKLFTGDIYEHYRRICSKIGIKSLTQRRVSDIIAEFDTLGIITARVISKGRYGRTREILLATQATMNKKLIKILEDAINA